MSEFFKGPLSKMSTLRTSAGQVEYSLSLGEANIALNDYLGQPITLMHTGKLYCIACGREVKKTFQQGYCFVCTQKLAECDTCLIKPERCHYHLGTCREPSWGEQHCLKDHYVYLANASGLKVGITRLTNVPTRWMDQGAVQALPILKVATRRLSGLAEVILAEHVADKTNWRKMLQGPSPELDLYHERDRLFSQAASGLDQLIQAHPNQVEKLSEAIWTFHYPVLAYPVKIQSLGFEATPTVSGTLMGIKGQYLLFDTGVFNVRKFTGYEVEFKPLPLIG